jgi:hypothetical protein
LIEQQKEYEKFSDTIVDFNICLQQLRNEFVEQLNLDEAATTSANCAFNFDIVRRVYLSRVINLSENYAALLNRKEALASALIGRALLETIAHFHHLLNKLEANLRLKQYAQVYYILCRFILGGDHGYAGKIKIKKIHVNESFESLDKYFEHSSDSYHWLSEFCHPNSHGTTLMFSRIDRKAQTIKFSTFSSAVANLSPALEAALYLPIFIENWKRSHSIARQIAIEWKFTEEVYDLFE